MNTMKIDRGQTKLIAHRGLSGIEQENTCAAFVAAGNRSYFGIETDVHVTADGGYVVFHDDTTARIGLDDLTVEKSTYETLRALRLTDKDGKRGRTDLRIPSLEEYILLCKKYEKFAVLELKNRFTKEQVWQIVSIISDLGWLANTIFISFEMGNLVDLREKYPDQPVQFLTDTYSDALIDELAEKQMDLDIEYTELTEDRIAHIHEKGLKVNCWTNDDPTCAQNLVSWGIDYITSNILE